MCYSGMLPGLVAGHYSSREAHIELPPLAMSAGARYVADRVIGLDLYTRMARLGSGEQEPFDIVSLDVGSTPDMRVPGAAQLALPVRPLAAFLAVVADANGGFERRRARDCRGRWRRGRRRIAAGHASPPCNRPARGCAAFCADHRPADAPAHAHPGRARALRAHPGRARRRVASFERRDRSRARHHRRHARQAHCRRPHRVGDRGGGGAVARGVGPRLRRQWIRAHRRSPAFDLASVRVRGRRLRHAARASATEVRRVRGAPGPAARRKPAPGGE